MLIKVRVYSQKMILLLVLTAIFFSCKRDPEWITELEELILKTTRRLEDVSPFFAESAQPAELFIGLARLEKIIDDSTDEARLLWQKHPEIRTQADYIDNRLRNRFQNLGGNMRKISTSIRNWDQKLKQKDFHDIVVRLWTKTQKAKSITIFD